MKGHIEIDRDHCTGCGACVQSCSVGAIRFLPDEKGFPYPEIDQEQCVQCGKCCSVCHLQHPETTNSIQGAYAVQHLDPQVLKESSSGGVFSAVASHFLSNAGIVYGCVFDETCTAVYRRISSVEEMAQMRGSKYVWADASPCYKFVKVDLDAGYRVLFCAPPCQVSGLLLYLGKRYQNLFTIDFLCGGPPSPYVFKEYIHSFTNAEERGKLNFKFRDKEKNGAGYCISYYKNNRKYYRSPLTSSYLYLFSNKMVQRDACYQCTFRGTHRAADATMGDFWGAKEFFPEWNDQAGISILLINSENGKEIVDIVKRTCKVAATSVDSIAKRNILRLDNTVKTIPIPANREKFFSMLQNKGWTKSSIKYTLTIKRIKKWFASGYQLLMRAIRKERE